MVCVSPPNNRIRTHLRHGLPIQLLDVILRDDQNDTWYHLDDQKRAAEFLGKKVSITGKLDVTTDFIYVQNIQAQE